MLEAKNVVIFQGGIVADPEMVGENIVRFRIGVDYSANDKVSNNTSGYFDITYFLNSGDRNADWVRTQIKEGKMKKGSTIGIVGRAVHDRWVDKDQKNQQRVTFVAESITYGSANRREEGTTTGGTEAKAETFPQPTGF